MKTNYTCEICNRSYDDEKEALKCEERHERSRKKKEANEKAKDDNSKSISNLINLYIKRFKEMPNIELDDDSCDIIFGHPFSTMLKDFFGI